MRICMLTSAIFPPREGMGFYIWNLSRYLVERGHSVQIITRGKMKRLQCKLIEGIPVWWTPFLTIYPLHVHFHNLFVERLLKNLVTELDLLHLHTPLVRYPKIDLPAIVTVHTPMIADSKAFSVDSPLALLAKLQTPISIRLEQEIFAKAAGITAVCSSVVQELSDYGIDRSSVFVLGNGVDTQVFSTRDPRSAANPPKILTVCRLGPRKGLEDLIACVRLVTARCPEIQFYIAGEGPYQGKIWRRIRSSNLAENVTLLGHISNREKLVELYQSATVFVHPAHYEGLPTVLLEAMSCGCSVVATAVSGALDVVVDGENGLLVPPHAPHHMAQAILRILNDPLLGERLGKAARKTIEERFSWQVVSQNYLTHYERLLRNPGILN